MSGKLLMLLLELTTLRSEYFRLDLETGQCSKSESMEVVRETAVANGYVCKDTIDQPDILGADCRKGDELVAIVITETLKSCVDLSQKWIEKTKGL